MKVLVACEESQAVCIELRKLGHEAYSCDVIDCSGGHPEWHIKQDVIPLLNGNCSFKTVDGTGHSINGKWDMIIAFPPCTYLTNVATRHFSLKCTAASKVVSRWKKRAIAAIFFMQFILADCEKIAVENPVGFMNTAYKKPDQIVEPYFFAQDESDAENYVTKKTCLWLKNLPTLERSTNLPKPQPLGTYITAKGKTKNIDWEMAMSGSDRAKIRSKTFHGIAKAMAEQWAGKNKEDK